MRGLNSSACVQNLSSERAIGTPQDPTNECCRAAGSHKISAQKFKYVHEFLAVGCSVLMSDIDVVYLQNPFHFLYKVERQAEP